MLRGAVAADPTAVLPKASGTNLGRKSIAALTFDLWRFIPGKELYVLRLPKRLQFALDPERNFRCRTVVIFVNELGSGPENLAHRNIHAAFLEAGIKSIAHGSKSIAMTVNSEGAEVATALQPGVAQELIKRAERRILWNRQMQPVNLWGAAFNDEMETPQTSRTPRLFESRTITEMARHCNLAERSFAKFACAGRG